MEHISNISSSFDWNSSKHTTSVWNAYFEQMFEKPEKKSKYVTEKRMEWRMEGDREIISQVDSATLKYFSVAVVVAAVLFVYLLLP